MENLEFTNLKVLKRPSLLDHILSFLNKCVYQIFSFLYK